MGKSYILLLLSFYLISQKCISQNTQRADSLRIVLNRTSNEFSRVMVMKELALVLREIKKLPEAVPYAEQIIESTDKLLSKSIKEDRRISLLTSKAKAFNILGSFHGSKSNYDTCRNFHNQAIKIQKEVKAYGDLIDSYFRIGHSYLNQSGNERSSAEYFKTGLSIAIESNHNQQIIEGYTNMMRLHRKLGNLSEAIRYGLDRVEAVKLSNDKKREGDVIFDLANVFIDAANYPEAIKYHKAALAVRQEIGDQFGTAACLNSLGIIYERHGNFLVSLDFLKNSLSIFEKLGNKTEVANTKKQSG